MNSAGCVVILALVGLLVITQFSGVQGQIGCDSCGSACSEKCGSRQFRSCCFQYIKKRSLGSLMAARPLSSPLFEAVGNNGQDEEYYNEETLPTALGLVEVVRSGGAGGRSGSSSSVTASLPYGAARVAGGSAFRSAGAAEH